ncbi:integrin beta [Elysia marginata]|uniref:Integrin beta n=1 Tax=Elysia marginata TaxID=1093978 RepID=A0AAV4GZP5_9GAST|nr:integrin beta [Elysia marginata]
MKMKCLLVFIPAFCLLIGAFSEKSEKNPCHSTEAQKSCAACIAAHKDCGWCVSPLYEKENRLRCDTYENHARGKCDTDQIQFPIVDTLKVDDADVRDGDTPEEVVQIQPQKVRVSIRPNHPVRIPLIFRQAKNYPVDLYYLMDLSNSMEDDKENLAELGSDIAKKMKTITKNFRLGFGSFVDKVVSPFVSTVPKKLISPCGNCEAPYGFKNQLKLDNETTKFAQQVKAARVSGNLDAPEGGFDAIMQSIACQDEIGWRNISRRMLLFSTDAGFHYAGDGKLGGIVTPNDGECHMENGLYTLSSDLDYPSVGQIVNKIKEKAVSIIFAITEDQFDIYERLSNIIEGSAVGVLANDSSNIVKLIEDNYDEVDSLKCSNGNGTFECGKCTCNPGRYGKFCECKADEVSSTDSIKLCIQPNATVPCSGRGECTCGECICNARSSDPSQTFSGEFCECDDYSCNQFEEQVCGGPIRGICDCGTCLCKPGYNGSACECELSQEKCKTERGIVCNNHGNCSCGKCDCEDGYSGLTCEQCFNCRSCREFEKCVKCFMDEEKGCPSDYYCPEYMKKRKDLNEGLEYQLCRVEDEDECFIEFTIFDNEYGEPELEIKKKATCPKPVNILAIVGGVVAGIVLVGLLLLLVWKLLTYIHDTREFAKFEKERQNAKWDTGENPIYKQATSTFKNPTYGGR